VASLTLIIPIVRRDAFDDPAWLFDLKLDGFRGLADTIASRMLSKNGFYGGPFFLSCDHSCAHGPTNHGAGIRDSG
jgi:hypothetical protein